ncbi:hypothetical protein [Methylobacterium symbioticum]|uniref:ASCH domain-containing protein n=1 Tax=Methylobacterium symbioticum TaxID=2584084 RepID=A0A509EBY0_9HYPH|nr:hypothetical protein [Methylobacterium symbioticum]VUD71806.1 hypothetical protein MET9862_02394 [Methylobacterium symbioticum]
MADRPIIFSAPMVQALLAGRKTQTRRILKLQPIPFAVDEAGTLCEVGCLHVEGDRRPRVTLGRVVTLQEVPYAVGDRLWVKEAFRIGIDADADDALDPYLNPDRFVLYHPPGMRDQDYIVPTSYEAPRTAERKRYTHCAGTPEAWTELGTISPRFMPRWASRLTLIVTDVRVQRLQDISEEDAVAEGAAQYASSTKVLREWDPDLKGSYRAGFLALWDRLHSPESTDANPWVAAISFTVHRANIDALRAEPLDVAGAA